MNQTGPIKVATSHPASGGAAESNRTGALLQIEAEARTQATVSELRFHLANSARKVLPYRQAFILRRRGQRMTLETISSIATVDRNAPMTRWIERMMRRFVDETGASEQRLFEVDGYSDERDPEAEAYPFRYFMWTPLRTGDGRVFAGLLTAKETPWTDGEKRIATRIAETYGHAWRALEGEKRVLKSGFRLGRTVAALLVAGLVAAGFIPVPLTAVAPMEVTAAKSTVISAGIEGVIQEVKIDENADVAIGDVLFEYDPDEIRNAYHIAERAVAVAEAKALRARQAAIASPEAKAELAVAAAELELARAERDFALSRTRKLVVHAPAEGVAVFADKREWAGRPVRLGERVMEIAEPGEIRFRVELAVNDAIVLKPDARVRVFLDSDPLNAVEATLEHGAYRAEAIEDGRLAYILKAKPAPDAPLPRIGTRGSAQVYGEDVPLALFLFRRPISAARQYLGL
ncbi:MAG: HlyD family efflux transporter periplasmic adaptor subunit [Pseudomonadota bacterium]